LPKERWRLEFILFSFQKIGLFNKIPSRQLYYLIIEPFMRYPLEKLSGY
jgi:hypothetical protein